MSPPPARPTFFVPDGDLTDGILRDMLSIVGAPLPHGWQAWTELERLLVYDWATREYLHASDVLVRRRSRPSLLGIRA